jgi:cellulose synthase/poly-beta-1,6-N-acetylglucosamine synthase-like glycosyltransferase
LILRPARYTGGQIMPLPRISVVVPSLNQAPFLAEAIDSVLSQGYPDLELIVMDGGSTDGSLDIIRSYEARLSFWRSAPDGGQSAAINRGVKEATRTISYARTPFRSSAGQRPSIPMSACTSATASASIRAPSG